MHERSITIQDEDTKKWVNISTVFNNQPLSEEIAVEMYRRGLIQPLGGATYDNIEAAEREAKARSREYRGQRRRGKY